MFCLNDKWYTVNDDEEKEEEELYTARTKPMIGRTFYGHAQFMYKYKNWAKRRYGIYLADSGKLFYRGIALRKETDEYHFP